MPILRTNDLVGIVDGSEPCQVKFLTNFANEKSLNPKYAIWQKKDQQLLSWMLCSLTPSFVSSMYGLNIAYVAWIALATHYLSQSPSSISHLKCQLQSLQQGGKSSTKYLQQAKQLAD
jgi:hypothetical protein